MMKKLFIAGLGFSAFCISGCGDSSPTVKPSKKIEKNDGQKGSKKNGKKR